MEFQTDVFMIFTFTSNFIEHVDPLFDIHIIYFLQGRTIYMRMSLIIIMAV